VVLVYYLYRKEGFQLLPHDREKELYKKTIVVLAGCDKNLLWKLKHCKLENYLPERDIPASAILESFGDFELFDRSSHSFISPHLMDRVIERFYRDNTSDFYDVMKQIFDKMVGGDLYL